MRPQMNFVQLGNWAGGFGDLFMHFAGENPGRPDPDAGGTDRGGTGDLAQLRRQKLCKTNKRKKTFFQNLNNVGQNAQIPATNFGRTAT